MMNSNPSMAMLSSWTDSMTNKKDGGRNPPPHNGRHDPDSKAPSRAQYEDDDLPMNREMRANSSLERFETWTDSMQKSKKATPSKKNDDGDGYEDEEFEDYDEDFEADEDDAPPKRPVHVEPAVPVRQAKTVSNYNSSNSQAQPIPTASRSNQQHVHQQQQEPERAEAKSTRASKFDNMQISLNSMRIADPRGNRIQKLLAANVLELSSAKSTILNTLPVSKYDLYMRNLRLPEASVRQIGVPLDQEKRDMDTNTNSIEVSSKSVQFSYGDDTAFYRTIDAIKAKREKKEYKQDDSSTDKDSNNSNNTTAAAADGDTSSIGATRLASFLQNASRVCEALLDEQHSSSAASKLSEESKSSRRDDSRSQYSVFDSSKDWTDLGKDASNGGNETVRTRRIASLRFSTLQPHLLVSAHVYPTDESAEMDLKPYKGLYCVWDAGNPGGPQYVLEGSGQPTVCCFSATQSHLVVGGTLEGSLHLWDLREPSSIHSDRDAVDLRIARGIRKPCYSTSLPYLGHYGGGGGSAQDTGAAGGEEEFQHSAPVVQVESISAYQGGGQQQAVVSQFVSLDEAGLVIFWVTAAQQGAAESKLFGDAGAEDLQRAPWGSVGLVQTRQIHTHSHTLYHSVASGRQGAGGGASLQGKVGMACIPSDLSTILVTGHEGEVRKVSRIGESPVPAAYHRTLSAIEIGADGTANSGNSASNSASAKGKRKGLGTNYFSAVSCLCVRDAGHSHGVSEDGRPPVTSAPLMLVGRHDGTVDLFALDCATPLQSWDLPSFIGSVGSGGGGNGGNKAKGGEGRHAVVKLQWCATRPSVFFAADKAGNLYHFDLHTQPGMPLSVEAVGVTDRLASGGIDVSHPRIGTGMYYVGVVKSGKSDCVSVRRGNAQITKVSDVQSDAENTALVQSLHRLSANKLHNSSVTYVSEGSDSNLQRK